MGRQRSVNYEEVVRVYKETGHVRATARLMGIHENTVKSILHKARGNCIDCGAFVDGRTVRCPECTTKRKALIHAYTEDHLARGLCVSCDERLAPSSRRHCVKHMLAAVEGTRRHRRKRIVNTIGTTLEAEKEFHVLRDYGEGGLAAWRRDKGCCILCGLSYADRAVYLHHIDRNRKNNVVENFVCLCYGCHRLVHGLLEHVNLPRFLVWFQTTYAHEQSAQLMRRGQRSAKRQSPEDATLTFDFAGS